MKPRGVSAYFLLRSMPRLINSPSRKREIASAIFYLLMRNNQFIRIVQRRASASAFLSKSLTNASECFLLRSFLRSVGERRSYRWFHRRRTAGYKLVPSTLPPLSATHSSSPLDRYDATTGDQIWLFDCLFF